MNCIEVAGFLDRMVFEDLPADGEIREHIDGCASCSQAYYDALKAREVINLVRRSEPILMNPARNTDEIMAALIKRSAKTPVVLPFLQRLLAAATVACFLLLGYEQYQVVKKVSMLEMQFSGIRPDSRYADPLRHVSAMDINKAGISFSEIERLLKSEKGTTPLSLFFSKKRLEQIKIK